MLVGDVAQRSLPELSRFAKGDVVRVKGGDGTRMTVDCTWSFRAPITQESIIQIETVWFDGAALRRAVFSEFMLEPVLGAKSNRFRSKAVEIEAFQLTAAALNDREGWPQWGKDALHDGRLRVSPAYGCMETAGKAAVIIKKPDGKLYADIDDWIVIETDGELYPCKPSVFERKYEPA